MKNKTGITLKIGKEICLWIILTAGFFISPHAVKAQTNKAFPLPFLVIPDTAHHKALSLQVSNREFVYDAEFFNPLEPGYTLLGFQLQPVIHYRVSSNFDLTTGIYLLKYSGMDRFVQWRPVLAATYRFNPSFSLTMGTLDGSLHHRLPEPLYKFDLSLSDNIEEGIQAILNTTRIRGDYWLDWRSFIQPGDPHQEELAFGTSTLFSPFPDLSSWTITIPVYSLIFHRGGQIDQSPLPVHTFGNIAGGVIAERNTESSFIHRYGLSFLVFRYFDASGNLLFPFSSGTAVYPKLEVKAGHWSFSGGYWWANHFFSLTGEPQFASVSENAPGRYLPDRQLIKMRLGYYRSLAGGPEFFFFSDGYWDLGRKAFDYSVGLQMIFNHTFDLLDL
ncbi:MAG: hypothetical protein GXO83_07865 [Chlorobi bacterium]|nr:hypothetical protein [Chlorobiota bacterium]